MLLLGKIEYISEQFETTLTLHYKVSKITSMTKTKQKAKESPEVQHGFKFRYIFTFTLFALLIFALFSHDKADLTVIEGGNLAKVNNWAGQIGAISSRNLLYLFGVAAYPITVLLMASGIRPFLPIPTHRKGYTGALFAIVTGLTLLAAMWPETFSSTTDHLGIGHMAEPLKALSGGVIGQQLAAPMDGELQAGIIRHLIGTVGTATLASVFLLTGLIFVYIADWHMIAATMINRYMERSGKEPKAREETKKRFEKKKKLKDEVNDDKDLVREEMLKALHSQEEHNVPILNEETTEYTDEKIDENEDEEDIQVLVPAAIPVSTPLVAPAQSPRAGAVDHGEYIIPPISLISKVKAAKSDDQSLLSEASYILQSTLESFKVKGKVTGVTTGPRVSRFEVSLEPGVKVEKITSISNNIAMELSAESIRILAPIPGKNAIGVEVPNAKPTPVFFRNMMESEWWATTKAELPIVLGKDVSGKVVILDLAKAPHLLIAGATGSGKSVCMNTLIMSMIMRFSPEELRLIMVDPKVVELEMYRTLPHLITPVVNESSKVPLALRWGVNEMEKRYRILAKVRAKNLSGFNSRPPDPKPVLDADGKVIPAKLPFLVIIVDELADVMMTDAKVDVETSIAKIAQKGRAAGIHIVIATQRPSTNIITGVIKANLPTRIAFRVGSLIDSRVILDQKGAEKLLGQGDMLFVPPGASNMERIQGAFVDDDDIQKVVDFSAEQRPQDFDNGVITSEEEVENEVRSAAAVAGDPIAAALQKYLKPDDSDLIKQSLEIIFTDRKASTSYLQRRLKIGYNRAAEIIDVMEERGIVSAPLPGGSKREILVTDGLEENKN